MSHAVTSCAFAAKPIPARAGIGLRAEHYQSVLESRADVGWLEVHSENYFGAGGVHLHYLDMIRAHCPLSLHGVGLSLGSVDPLDRAHLAKLKTLIARCEPGLVSEHLSWCSVDGRHLNDLLPLPYTEEALTHFVARVLETQDYLRRQILIENPSSYLRFTHSTIPEWEFLREVACRSGCTILLDVNNVYVSAVNHGFDAKHYLESIPAAFVEEMHLAGHTRKRIDGTDLVIDSHNQPVADPVWTLYEYAVQRFPNVPTLIEWDSDLPALSVLLSEAERAQRIMDRRHAVAA